MAEKGLSASLSASLNGLSTSLLPYPLHKIAREGLALAAVHAWHIGKLATEGDKGDGCCFVFHGFMCVLVLAIALPQRGHAITSMR